MNQVIISPLNGIRFVPADVILSPRYNRPQFDQEWYYDLIYRWQSKPFYGQKIQKKDILSLQIMANKDASIVIKLLNCQGITLSTNNFLSTIGLPMPLIKGTVMQYFQYINASYWSGLSEGGYFLSIEITFPDSSQSVFLSEPIDLKTKHEGTVLLEYQNSYNKDNALFEQTSQKFNLRMAGYMQLAPALEKTVFQDQGYNSSLLSGTAYRNWDVVFGGNNNAIPEYQVDQLNHILALDAIKIDGKAFTVIDDSSLNIARSDGYPLVSPSVTLGEVENMDNSLFLGGDLVVIESIPAYPFAIFGVQLGTENFIDWNYDNPFLIINPANWSAYTSLLNSNLTAFGLTGSMEWTGSQLVYHLGAGENIDTANATIATQKLNIKTVIFTSSLIEDEINYEISGNAYFAIFIPENNTSIAHGSLYDLPAVAEFTTEYPVSSSINLTYPLYYIGDITRISINANNFNGLDGDIPEMLGELVILNSQKLNSFSIYPLLMPAQNSLFRVQVNNCPNLQNPGIIAPNTTIPGLNLQWKFLKQYYFFGNNIPSSNIDNFFNSFNDYYNLYYNHDGTFVNGDIHVEAQNPPAPPTNASATARAVLTNTLNWILHTD